MAEPSVEELKKLEVKDDDEVTPGYKAPAKVDLKTLQELDADDESLQKYKKDLLGAEAQLDEGGSNVLVKKLEILFEDSAREPISLDLTEDLSTLKSKVVKIKEGTKYRLKISFRVQREIVAGLRFFTQTFRKGIKLDKSNYMVGSYGPKKDAHTYMTSFEEAPSGLLARGTYVSKSKFCDDDKNVFLEWEWAFEIAKSW